ncbi:MAG: hemolysin family protein [Candidatus Omnitrophica bacterium]|nr:hemolysin family protein [Candidatus Omnitrophota bacterium]
MLLLIFLLVGVLIFSGFCSMAEAAILSMPLVKTRVLVEQKRRGAGILLYIKENISLAVATIVILNNSINIVGSIFVGQRVTQLFGNNWLGIASAVITFAIIIISEVIPKTIGEQYKVRISLATARPLRVLIILLKPLVGLLVFVTFPFKKKSKLIKVTEEEIKIMLRLGRVAGTVEMDEETLCNRVFKLNDLTARHMMKPLENVYALDAGKSLASVKEEIINSPYSRIVVFEGDLSRVRGIAQQRVLLREIARDNYTAKVYEYMARPIFVAETEKADHLLEKFQSYNQHLFIVQDSRKQNVGLLTMEDVLEELFGEIYDERDRLSYKSRLSLQKEEQ